MRKGGAIAPVNGLRRGSCREWVSMGKKAAGEAHTPGWLE
jgi:hypothetical protein